MSKLKISFFLLFLIFFPLATLVVFLSLPKQIKALKPLETKTNNNLKTKLATAAPTLKISSQIKVGTALVTANNFLVTQNGNDLLVLVNKKISLPEDFVPQNLVSLDGVVKTFKHESLRADATSALKNLLAAAVKDNINLTVVSAYRSYQDQQVTFNGWVASAGLSAAESFSARPGHSQHQLGTAIDFGSTSGAQFASDFGKSPEGVWLAQNATKFGYVLSYPSGKESITGYAFEPWHYRYIGEENASKLVSSGLILEQFLEKYGNW